MSTRLSSAASLLRNSKLFALPPTVALPPKPPSADQVAGSDTATTIYPQYAAIQTTSVSGRQGDWGFKRPLPLKATRSTNNPVVRLVRGIDTPEHVADFESAADHVLTLRKFQELNIPLRHAVKERTSRLADRRDFNVFRPTHDNTTNLSSSSPAHAPPSGVWPHLKSEDMFSQLPEKIQQQQLEVDATKKAELEAQGVDPTASGAAQLLAATSRPPRRIEQKRWRYAGPSLVQITGMEFDDYLRSLGEREKKLLRERIITDIIQGRRVRERDQGITNDNKFDRTVTDDQVAEHLRRLRNEPGKFGPMIADILDLPEATPAPGSNKAEFWEYGRDTVASAEYAEKGPPRTHPSAGLSYVHTTHHVANHPTFGPLSQQPAAPARVVRTRARSNAGVELEYGVAGFVVPQPDTTSSRGEVITPGGGPGKAALRPGPASIRENGSLLMRVERASEYKIVNGSKAMLNEEANQLLLKDAGTPKTGSVPQMSGNTGSSPAYQSRTRHAEMPEYKKNESHSSQDADDILAQLGRMSQRP